MAVRHRSPIHHVQRMKVCGAYSKPCIIIRILDGNYRENIIHFHFITLQNSIMVCLFKIGSVQASLSPAHINRDIFG